jgi:hypothetical protein
MIGIGLGLGGSKARAGVFFEPNANIVPNPQAISGWTMTSAAGTADTMADPSGTSLADTVTDTGGGATGTVIATSTACTNVVNVTYRLSLYVKAGSAPFIRFGVINAGTGTGNIYFNTATGALGTATAAVVTSGVDAPINGWYRPWYTFVSDAADVSCNVQVHLTSANNVTTILRNGTQTVHLWLAQLARP